MHRDGLVSNLADYLSLHESVVVGWRIFSEERRREERRLEDKAKREAQRGRR